MTRSERSKVRVVTLAEQWGHVAAGSAENRRRSIEQDRRSKVRPTERWPNSRGPRLDRIESIDIV